MPKQATRITRRGGRKVTLKRTGYITTSLRLQAEENRELRRFAKKVGLSFNGWGVQTLLNEARKGKKTNGKAYTEE